MPIDTGLKVPSLLVSVKLRLYDLEVFLPIGDNRLLHSLLAGFTFAADGRLAVSVVCQLGKGEIATRI